MTVDQEQSSVDDVLCTNPGTFRPPAELPAEGF